MSVSRLGCSHSTHHAAKIDRLPPNNSLKPSPLRGLGPGRYDRAIAKAAQRPGLAQALGRSERFNDSNLWSSSNCCRPHRYHFWQQNRSIQRRSSGFPSHAKPSCQSGQMGNWASLHLVRRVYASHGHTSIKVEQRPNNSFKPSPLRGLGRDRFASGGPA